MLNTACYFHARLAEHGPAKLSSPKSTIRASHQETLRKARDDDAAFHVSEVFQEDATSIYFHSTARFVVVAIL